mmetsp:Transcript_95275/g.274427  ORF Transcript_95275/g.274427 Transcript_95275/m.274427 type:complete len:463 (+) Transcript_95275:86-1474(+)
MAVLSRALVLLWMAAGIDGRRHSAGDSHRAAASSGHTAGGAFSPKPYVVGALLRPFPAGVKPLPQPLAPQDFEPMIVVAHGRVPTELAARATGPARTDGGPRPRRSRFIGRLLGLKPTPGISLVGRFTKWELVPQEQLERSPDSEVWKARLATREEGARDVAVKLERLGPGPHARETRENALREAAMMERFSGGRFLEYFGWWERRDRFMRITEIVDGDLHELVIDRPFEEVDIFTRVGLFTELMEGLRIMEEQGFEHRRITPRSIMLKRDEDGKLHVKIANVGEACSFATSVEPQCDDPAQASEALVTAGAAVVGVARGGGREDRAAAGTAAFTASSASDGGSGELGPKADIFDAGLILYQLVFEGNLPDMLPPPTLAGLGGRAWNSYDVSQDRRLTAALAAIEEPRDSWFGGLLDILELMLSTDPEWRLDAATVHLALLELAWQENRAQQILFHASLADA